MQAIKPDCSHEIRSVAGVGVVACAGCGTVEWWHQGRLLDPAEGMARVFGQFDLVGTLPGLRTPAPTVNVYRPPQRRSRNRLAVFPPGVWLEAHPGLAVTQDGEHLLVAPTDPLLAANLRRD